jgi:uncharacterized spore protein YtfJ
MSMDNPSEVMAKSISESLKYAADMGERIFGAASNEAVYSQPITHGDYMVITASEVTAGGGFGIGSGYGSTPKQQKAGEEGVPEGEQKDKAQFVGGVASGGGGGGGSAGRPVAVVVIGPQGVQIEPVFDRTKLGLALLTTLGAMAIALGRMNRMSRQE